MRRSCVAIVGIAAITALSGCGAESSDTNSPTATVGSSGATVELGNTINFGGSGVTTEIDCADGKSLNVGLNNNTLTVKGTCAEVRVGGSDNTITLDQVDKLINVVGSDNKVTFKAGSPKIETLGNNNQVANG
jgi:Protein of unknown function (DUF3060)